MKRPIPLLVLAFALVGCAKPEEPADDAAAPSATSASAAPPAGAPAADPTNTPNADQSVGGTATKPGEAGPP